jgi:DUF1680 family protein
MASRARKQFHLAGLALWVCITLATSLTNSAAGQSPYAVTPVPHTAVTITDAFWSPRIENNRTETINSLLAQGPNLRVMEAACYSLAHHDDAALRAQIAALLDPAIEDVRRDKGRWPQEFDGSLPTPGYFFETAVAYHELTGDAKLLEVAREIADDIDSLFGPGKRHDISNHEGIKNGLVRLYRATSDERYLKLAEFFLERRGNPEHREIMYGEYAQDHAPVVDQQRAIGHSVRATYLYMALTDLAALTGRDDLRQANERIWWDAVSKRTYLTGGVGAYRDEEDFSADYTLPNLNAWNENCAAYGAVMWNQKLFQLTNDATYVDMLERTLYNGFLVGIALDGKTYLYQAPLRTYGDFDRHASFGPNCCPPNIARLFPQLGGMIYAQEGDNLYVNLFMANAAKADLAGGPVELKQETRYPWDGKVKLTVSPDQARAFKLHIRAPGYTRGEPMPGGLYRYLDDAGANEGRAPMTLAVNGADVPFRVEQGYATIDREWNAGDVVEFELAMPVRRVVADERVLDDRGMVALERGPLVYCVERVDNPNGVFNLVLRDDGDVRFEYRDDLLGGVGTLKGAANSAKREAAGPGIVVSNQSFTAIPYYAFANRGPSEMTVWLPRDPAEAWVDPAPTIAAKSQATSSVGNGTVAENYPGNNPPTIARRFFPLSQDGSGSIRAIQDQLEPISSEDGSAPYFRMRPQSGDTAWVQYDFAEPMRVASVDVYWKDDKQACIPPASWQLFWKDGDAWKPVAARGEFGVALDRYNRVDFDPVTTAALRMEIKLAPHVFQAGKLGPPDGNYLDKDLTWYEGGLIEWRVNP